MADLIRYGRDYVANAQQNLSQTFSKLSAQNWIRLIIVVGAYLLLRPYIIKLGRNVQMSGHERESARAEAEFLEQEARKNKATITASDFRGDKVDLDKHEGSDEDAAAVGAASSTTAATGADWGKKARRRQRDMIKNMLEAEEKRLQDLQDDEDDKEIQEFLID